MTEPRSTMSRIFRSLAFGSVLAIAAVVVTHFAWKYSGSSQWQLEMNRAGIQIYSRKVPGSVLKEWKAVRRMRLSLSRAVAAIMSTDAQDSADWDRNSTSVEVIQPLNPRDLTYIHLYRLNLRKPFQPRELLVRAKATQDPRSLAVVADFTASPDERPRNRCCMRVTEFQHIWRFTPLENGEIEVVCETRQDLGLPYFLVDRAIPGSFYELFTRVPRLLSKEKFQYATFEAIQEKVHSESVDASPATAIVTSPVIH